MIVAIVLAAGESRRMGTQKLLLPFGDTTVVGAVVRAVRGSRADRALVVLGSDHEAVRDALEPPNEDRKNPGAGETHPGRLGFAVNPGFRLGMLTSIQAGLRALPPEAKAAVIVLGDQPFLAPRVIDEIVEAYGRSAKGIVIPAFRGRRGHPVLIDLKHRNEALALDPCDGLRALMLAHPEDILEVEVSDPNILRDLDTPEDYECGVGPQYLEHIKKDRPKKWALISL